LDTLEAVVIYGKYAWQTPTTNMDMVRSEEGIKKRKEFRASIGRKSIPDGNLGEQMQRVIKHGHPAPANPSTDGSRLESWATPQASDHIEGRRTDLDSNQKCLGRDMKQFVPPSAAKLNPRWVETLMGLPIGWTMPSCTRPVTIAQMNCDCLGTGLSQPPQNEHLELF